jgi:hypothetical protein
MKHVGNRFGVVVVALGAVLVLLAADALAQRGGGRRPGRNPSGKNRRSSRDQDFAVVRVGDEIRVVRRDRLEDLHLKIEEEFEEEVRVWQREKEWARERDQDFDRPRPQMKAFRVLADSVETAEEAGILREKWTERLVKQRVIGFSILEVDGKRVVVRSGGIDDFKAKLDAEHRQSLEEYAEARRQAALAGTPFEEPRPKRPRVRILDPTFRTESEAKEHLEPRRPFPDR